MGTEWWLRKTGNWCCAAWSGVLMWAFGCAGSSFGDGGRNITVDQAERDVAHAVANIRVRRRDGNIGCADEISVWLSLSFPSVSAAAPCCRTGWAGALLMGWTDTRACRTRHNHPRLLRGQYLHRRRGFPRYIREVEGRVGARR